MLGNELMFSVCEPDWIRISLPALSAICVCVTTPALYIQVLKKIARFIKDQNEKIYAPRGLLLTDPIERGLRVVSLHQWGQ